MAKPSEFHLHADEQEKNCAAKSDTNSTRAGGPAGIFSPANRRTFLQGAAAVAALAAVPRWAQAHPDEFDAIRAEIEKRHDEAVKRLQTWIRQPSSAAENRGMNEGCELMMEMLREAGFSSVKKVPTDGQPGVYATLDAGAPKPFGLYFMYDVRRKSERFLSRPRSEENLAFASCAAV